MKPLPAIALVAVGIVTGWFLRDAHDDPAQQRRSERVARETEPKPETLPETPDATKPEPESSTPTPHPDTQPALPEKVDDPEAKKFAQFMKGMLPLLRLQAPRQGREYAAGLAKLLDLDEQRETQIAELYATNEVRKMEEGLIPLLEGQEPTDEMVANLNEKDGISAAFEKDLSTVLSAHEIDRVREHNRKEEAVQRRERVESEIKSLAIPELSEVQEQQLREVLLAEQNERGSESTIGSGNDGAGLKLKLKKAFSSDGMVDDVVDSYTVRRDRLARFLTPAQLEHLDKQYAEERKEAEATKGLLGGLFGALVAPKKG